MSPDLKRFFQGLRQDAAAVAAIEAEAERQQQLERARQQAAQEERGKQEALLRARREQAAIIMAETAFPTLIQELGDLRLQARKGGPSIYKDGFPTSEYYQGDCDTRGMHGPHKYIKTRWSTPYVPRPESEYKVALWGGGYAETTRHEKGFAVDVNSDGEIWVVGATTQVLRPGQWRGNIDLQGSALEKAYKNPFGVKNYSREFKCGGFGATPYATG